jgi:hypothetical protein
MARTYDDVKRDLVAAWKQCDEWETALQRLEVYEIVEVYNLMDPVVNAKSSRFPVRDMQIPHHIYELGIRGWKYAKTVDNIRGMYPEWSDKIQKEVNYTKC